MAKHRKPSTGKKTALTRGGLIALTAGSIPLLFAGGVASAYLFDLEVGEAAAVPFAQTQITVDSPLPGLQGTEGLHGQETTGNAKNGYQHVYPKQSGTLTKETVDALTKTDYNIRQVINFHGESTPHRNTSVAADATKFIEKISAIPGAQVYAGFVDSPEACNDSVLEKAAAATGKVNLDEGADKREGNAHFCLAAKLPGPEGDHGTYTNVGTVTGKTLSSEGEVDVEASDSWSTEYEPRVPDYSELAESLTQPVIDVDMTTQRGL